MLLPKRHRRAALQDASARFETPPDNPPGFGVRQSSAAFSGARQVRKLCFRGEAFQDSSLVAPLPRCAVSRISNPQTSEISHALPTGSRVLADSRRRRFGNFPYHPSAALGPCLCPRCRRQIPLLHNRCNNLFRQFRFFQESFASGFFALGL